jgi:hypothetical protein
LRVWEIRFTEPSFEKISSNCQDQSRQATIADPRSKNANSFSSAGDEALSIAMRIGNPDCAALTVEG